MQRHENGGSRKTSSVRIQPRIPGYRRKPVTSAINRAIEHALTGEMRRYGVSRSFVIANALAFVFQIEQTADEDYRHTARHTSRNWKGRHNR